MKTKLTIGLSLIAALAAGQLNAESLTLDTADFLTIRSGSSNQNGNNVALIGQTPNPGGTSARGLLSFDFSNTGVDFSKVTVDKITITFTAARSDNSADANVTLNLHELTQAFNPDQATWTDASTGTAWDAIGGTYNASVLASTEANPGTIAGMDTISFSGSGLDAVIMNALLSNSSVNLLLKLDVEDRIAREMFFLGRGKLDGTITPPVPNITIEYTPTIPEAGDVAMIAGSAAALTVLFLRKRLRRRA